jgi:MarR family transcriptional regulator, organic hydroperoxide resistance regulator
MEPISPKSVYRAFIHLTRLHFNRTHSLLEPLGIYPGQPPVLFSLEHEEGISQKELAHRLNIRPATITVMLRRMEQNGWVQRQQDQTDQRVSRVFLTEAGRRLCGEAKEAVKSMEQVLFGQMSEDELEQLQRLLGQARENLLHNS